MLTAAITTALARLPTPTPNRTARLSARPVRGVLDAGLRYEIPGRAVLAEHALGPALTRCDLEAFSDGTGVLARPAGSSVRPQPVDVPGALARALRALPTLPEEPHHYRMLRLYGAEAEDTTLAPYVDEAVRYFRSGLRRAPSSAARPPALSGAEHKANSRARFTAREYLTSVTYLHAFLGLPQPEANGPDWSRFADCAERFDDDFDEIGEELVDCHLGEAPSAGTAIRLDEARADALDAIGAYLADAERDKRTSAARSPGQRVFNRAARDFFKVQRGAAGLFLVT